MTRSELARYRRKRRIEDGDCAHCGRERESLGVLCDACRERNNAPRRTGRPVGRPKGTPWSVRQIRAFGLRKVAA